MPIDLEFRGLGNDLLSALKAQREMLAGLRSEFQETNAAIQRGAQNNVRSLDSVNTALGTAAQLTAELASNAQSGGTSRLAKDLDGAAKSAGDLGRRAADGASLVTEELQQMVAAGKQVAAQQGIQIKAIDQQRKTTLQLLVAAGALTQEEADFAAEALAVTEALQGQTSAIDKSVAGAKSLKQQYAEAKNEAVQLAEKFGQFSPQAIEAAKRAAELKDRIGDLNDTLNALNPDAKFAAFGQVITSLAGGFTAAQGALALFGQESEDVQKGLLKVQAALAITQGLQAFFGGFADGLKNIRSLLGLTTTAQVASTAATEADVVAKGAQTAATVATTTATNALTGAVVALEAALLANPFTAIAAAVGLLITSIVLLIKSTDEETLSAEKLLDKLKEIEDVDLADIGFAKSLELLESEKQAIQEGNDARSERSRIIRDAGIEQLALEREIAAMEKQRQGASEGLLTIRQQLADQGREATDEEKDGIEQLVKAETEANKRKAELGRELVLLEKKTANEVASFDQQQAKERLEKDKEAADARKKLRQQLAQDILNLEKQIAAQVQQAQLQAADPRERLELERQAADAEIEQLRQDFLRKLALVKLQERLSVDAFNALSEAERNARADALAQQENLQLPESSNAKLAELSLLAQQEFAKKSIELTRQETETRLQLIQDSSERELEAFQLTLEKKLEELRKAGATEAQLVQFQAQQRDQFTRQQAQKQLDQEEELAIARIEAQRRGAESELAFRNRIELEKLAVQEQFAQARLAAIATDSSQEGELLRAQLQKVLADIATARAAILANPVQVNIFDLLGITNEDGTALTDKQKEQLNKDLATIRDTISQGIGAIIQGQIDEVDARISATDQIIEDAQRRREELQAQLQQEQEDQRAGLASNVDSVRAAIETQNQLEQQALADKKRLVAERQKLARQQAIADSISQASSLATAGAQLFADGATKGIPGVIAAIAFAATLISTFLSIKAKIRSATADTPTFRKGGYKSPFILSGPSHERGGLSIVAPGGRKVAEAEGNEGLFFVRRENARKTLPALHAINEANWAKVAELALGELTHGLDIDLEPTRVTRIVQQKQQLQAATTIVHMQSNKEMERGIRTLTDEVRGFRSDARNEDEVVTLSDGRRMEKKGTTRRTTKARRP